MRVGMQYSSMEGYTMAFLCPAILLLFQNQWLSGWFCILRRNDAASQGAGWSA